MSTFAPRTFAPRTAVPRTALPAVTGRLNDGAAVALRPLRSGEHQPVIDVFEGMSAQSRYFRFLYPVPRLREPMLRQLTSVDDWNHLAWVAFSGRGPLAIGRFIRLAGEPDTADFAVAVRDSEHGRGLGRLLLTTVAASAMARGVNAFSVSVHPENRASLALLRSYGARLRVVSSVFEGRVPVAAILAGRQRRTGGLETGRPQAQETAAVTGIPAQRATAEAARAALSGEARRSA